MDNAQLMWRKDQSSPSWAEVFSLLDEDATVTMVCSPDFVHDATMTITGRPHKLRPRDEFWNLGREIVGFPNAPAGTLLSLEVNGTPSWARDWQGHVKDHRLVADNTGAVWAVSVARDGRVGQWCRLQDPSQTVTTEELVARGGRIWVTATGTTGAQVSR